MQDIDEFGQDVWWTRNNETAHRGRDRRGVRTGDLVKEAVFDNDISSPRVEIPVSVMKGRTFAVRDGMETDDRLTAADQALWYYLIARAKDQINKAPREGSDGGLKDKSAYGGRSLVHEVSVKDLLAYLGTANPTRLRESLERIGETWARYDIRYRRTRLTKPVRYLAVDDLPEKLRSKHIVRYEIDPAVRVGMLMTRRFVTIDLNAVSKFRCRYSARLYARFALMASRHSGFLETSDGRKGRFWIASPENLAREVGYPMASFRMLTFVATMRKAIDEINALPAVNHRFEVVTLYPTDRLPRFGFGVSEMRKTAFDLPAPWIKPQAFRHAVEHRWPKKRKVILMSDEQFVRIVRVAQAQAFTEVDALKISQGWRADVEAANAGEVATVIGWSRDEFLNRIKKYGAEAVFGHWLNIRAQDWKAEIEAAKEKASAAMMAQVVVPKLLPDPMPIEVVPELFYGSEDDDHEEDFRIGDDWGNLYVCDDAA